MGRRSSLLVALVLVALCDGTAAAQETPTLIRDHGPAPTPARGGSSKPPPPIGAPPAGSDGAIELRVHDAPELDAVMADAERGYERTTLDEAGGPSLADELSPEEARLAREEARVPRPPLPDVALEGSLRWQRHGEIGAELAWVSRPFAAALGETGTHYRPAVGLGVHLQWDLVRWLQLRPYFVWAAHDVVLSSGALTSANATSIRPDTVFDPIQASTFAAGVKLAPTWDLGRRARAWVVAGLGYGRVGFRGVSFTEPGSKPITMVDRDGVFVEVPLGLGAAYEILPGRAALVFEATGAPAFGQSGSAHDRAFQVVDPDGRLREVGGFGAFDATFVQTFGLAVLL